MLFRSENPERHIYTIETPDFYRIPFESLIDLRGLDQNKTLLYLDPTRVSTESFLDSYPYSNTGIPSSSLLCNPQFGFENQNSKKRSSRQFKDTRYIKSINNFLAETANFFLKNESLTSFTSQKTANLVKFIPGKTYEMYLKIEKDNDAKMVLDTETTTPYLRDVTT